MDIQYLPKASTCPCTAVHTPPKHVDIHKSIFSFKIRSEEYHPDFPLILHRACHGSSSLLAEYESMPNDVILFMP